MILPQTATGGYGIRPYGCMGAYPTPRIRRNAYNKENAPMSQMTKRALVASLKDLLAEKPLDKITVTDLTEHCGVNRMTFYYHFKDIYDLVEWACIENATRALAGQKTYDTWQQGFLQILQAVQKDKVFVTKVYHSISREHIENYLYRLTYDLMIGVVEVLKVAQQIIEANRMASPNAAFGIYLVVFLLYFLACWPISLLASYLEKKWR